jgi:hypothetical protein
MADSGLFVMVAKKKLVLFLSTFLFIMVFLVSGTSAYVFRFRCAHNYRERLRSRITVG